MRAEQEARAGTGPRVSVVVPAYNVAAYLEDCLESLRRQTLTDLEVVVVDDGSTDETATIAERFASRDPRFRVLRQENAGGGSARNAGIALATGEYLAFADGDDVVPPRAYEALLETIEETGSDIASGGVRRLTSLGTTPARFLGDVFERKRERTHITRFPGLVVDRLDANKLFRRSFLDEHGLRFPEGRIGNHDIWFTLPAHYLARAVDVVPETVYLWRRREAGDLSLSQGRVGPQPLRDRARAVDHVSRFLAERDLEEEKLLYDRSVLGQDFRYYLDVLEAAGDEVRDLFLELANDFLDRADPRALDQPLAIERLKWHLVRRRALPELLEVLAFQALRLRETPPVRRLRTWYGDYPYRTDRRLAIPRDVYRLDEELAPVARVEDVRWEGETLRVEGYAYIETIGAPSRRSQRVEVAARSGERSVRARVGSVHRPDVTAASAQALASLEWSGFAAELDARKLVAGARGRRRGKPKKAQTWTLAVVLRAGGVERETDLLRPAPLHVLLPAETSAGGASVRAAPTPGDGLEIRVRRPRTLVRSCAAEGGVLALAGDVGAVEGEALVLRLARKGSRSREYPVEVAGTGGSATFAVRVPLGDLLEGGPDDGTWSAQLTGAESRRTLFLDVAVPEARLALDARELAVERGHVGNLRIVERSFRPVVTRAEWSPEGRLALEGVFLAPAGDYELVAFGRRPGTCPAFPLRHDAAAGRFTAELEPAGPAPLPEGRWELLVRPRGAGRPEAVNLLLDHELLPRLPLPASVGRPRFALGAAGYDRAVLAASRDLDPGERGGFNQRLLRRGHYRSQRSLPVRDAVLYESFGGLEYSDSPRAIHEELVRRGLPLEHLWVVRDGAFAVPESAVAVRHGSREHHDAYATARWVVANDHFPLWVLRRPEQTWVQTWHGPPLKLLGRDLRLSPKAIGEYRRTLAQPSANWDVLVSPGPFATPILRRAFSEDARVLEAGLPRTDLLLRPALGEDVRRRLGLAEGARVVLYAPTYRDHLGMGEGYLPGVFLDVAALREALGEDDVLLVRRHRLMVDTLPPALEGVLDVTAFPDGTELLAAADVLVTDYSSAIFDFAATGRPILFHVPDLETYRERVRGFSIDFEADVPGPLLRTTAEVAEALRALDAVGAATRARYESFVARYCSLLDGAAGSRVVDELFGP